MKLPVTAEQTPPTPGSQEAADMGCTCPVHDNLHGAGVPWPRTDGKDPNEHPSFWMTEGCPIHG